MRSFAPVVALLAVVALASVDARAEGEAKMASATLLDRVVVRWHAPESGGVAKPQFIHERELAFQARVEALAESEKEAGSFKERHVRSALDRHIAESLLAALPITPEPTPKEIAARAEAARAIVEQRVHGRDRLIDAAAAEGISSDELDALLRRQARASLYLDRMVAPMLEPGELELREAFKSGATPFKDAPFDKIQPALKRWYVGQKLAQATEAYYQAARARVVVVIVKR